MLKFFYFLLGTHSSEDALVKERKRSTSQAFSFPSKKLKKWTYSMFVMFKELNRFVRVYSVLEDGTM